MTTSTRIYHGVRLPHTATSARTLTCLVLIPAYPYKLLHCLGIIPVSSAFSDNIPVRTRFSFPAACSVVSATGILIRIVR